MSSTKLMEDFCYPPIVLQNRILICQKQWITQTCNVVQLPHNPQTGLVFVHSVRISLDYVDLDVDNLRIVANECCNLWKIPILRNDNGCIRGYIPV
jgi:hypothetical protein